MSTSVRIFKDMEQIEVYAQQGREKKEKEKRKEKEKKNRVSHLKEKSVQHTEKSIIPDCTNPTVIDNTNNQEKESEYAVPENKIIRFTEVSTQSIDPPLRIRKPVDSVRENTNTPTVKKRDEKRKRCTRRGKRAGKGKAVVEATNQSYVDFIVDEDPTVTANTTMVQSPADVANNASTIEIPMKEDSVLTEAPAKPEMPLLQDVIQCTAMYLDPQEHVPKVGLVEGRVISYE